VPLSLVAFFLIKNTLLAWVFLDQKSTLTTQAQIKNSFFEMVWSCTKKTISLCVQDQSKIKKEKKNNN
jgi:hypothetical protein